MESLQAWSLVAFFYLGHGTLLYELDWVEELLEVKVIFSASEFRCGSLGHFIDAPGYIY